jgi:mycothiol synthase
MDLEWRALGACDARAAAGLIAAVEAVDQEGESFGEADWADEMNSPSIDTERGVFGAYTDDGLLVAFSVIYAQTETEPAHEMYLWGAVHPEFRGRGIGTALLERSAAAATLISTLRFPGAPAELHCSMYDKLTETTALFENNGFTARQYEFSMRRPLTQQDAEAEPSAPECFALVGFEPSLSEEFRRTHNAALVPDLPGESPATPESWAARIEADSTRPDLSFGVRDLKTGTLVAYLLGKEYNADAEDRSRREAYINYIGTRREHRGRGLAASLIAATAHAAARQGFDALKLGVLAENPSGALSVYRRCGFEVTRRFVEYVRKL